MIGRKYNNHTLHTSPQNCEEERQNTTSQNKSGKN